jgi:hypothetical protein
MGKRGCSKGLAHPRLGTGKPKRYKSDAEMVADKRDMAITTRFISVAETRIGTRLFQWDRNIPIKAGTVIYYGPKDLKIKPGEQWL